MLSCALPSVRRACKHLSFTLLLLSVLGPLPVCRAQTYKMTMPMSPDRHGNPRPDADVSLWIPGNCKYVRGVVVPHPQCGNFIRYSVVRKVVVEENLATLAFPPFAFTGTETLARLDKAFDVLAKKSGHPELRGAALFTIGFSASVLASREVACAAPGRVFGTLHGAGGNVNRMQTYSPENRNLDNLLEVPFLAMNGEVESVGPAGPFLRAHLGTEDQWWTIKEELLKRRGLNPRNFMSLLVVPGGGHGAWNIDIGALFLKKAAQYRLPVEKRDGSTPARCRALKLEDGWLTDGEIKYPTYEAAPYNAYKGPRDRAFWHFDKEMAMTIEDYHRGKFRPAGLLEKVWPLGEEIDIAFKGTNATDYAEGVRTFLAERLGLDPLPFWGRCLAALVAIDLSGDKPQKSGFPKVKRDAWKGGFHAYDDAYGAIDAAITASAAPPAFKAVLRRYYGETVLWPPLHEMGVAEPIAPIAAITPAFTVVELGRGETLQDALARGFPGLDAMSPMSRWLVIDGLRRWNPHLSIERSFRVQAGEAPPADAGRGVDILRLQVYDLLYHVDPALRPPEAGEGGGVRIDRVAMPLGKNAGNRVFEYRLGPEPLLLVPPSAMLEALGRPERLDLRNLWLRDLSMLEGFSPVELDLSGCDVSDLAPLAAMKRLKRLVLSGVPAADVAPLQGLKLLAELDLSGTAVEDLEPLRGLPLVSLNLAGTRVRDLRPLSGMKLQRLDLHRLNGVDLAPLKGMPLTDLRLGRLDRVEGIEVLAGIASLANVGDVPKDLWVKEYQQTRAARHARKKPLLPLTMAGDVPAQEQKGGDWPWWRGPHGNNTADDCGSELVASVAQARLVWKSEERLPHTGADKYPRPRIGSRISGGHASPVLADGRVYIAYFVPNGPAYDESRARQFVDAGGMGRERWYTDADDVILCVDAATGRTAWKRVFKQQGYNIDGVANRASGRFTPCVTGGRVYVPGSAATVCCLDAGTGEPLWVSDLGFRARKLHYVKQWSREHRRLQAYLYDQCACFAASGGVVAITDSRVEHYTAGWIRDGGNGLLAFDAATGVRLWYRPDGARSMKHVPLRWEYDGKAYFVGSGRFHVYCVEARTGKETWSFKSKFEDEAILDGNRLYCLALSGELRSFEISPSKPVSVEAFNARCEIENPNSLTVHDKRLFVDTRRDVLCMDPQTGAVLTNAPLRSEATAMALMDGRIVKQRKGAGGVEMLYADLDRFVMPPPPPLTASYGRRTSPILANGRLYLRGHDRLYCYELRRAYTGVSADEAAKLLEIMKTGNDTDRAQAALALQNTAPGARMGVLKAVQAMTESSASDARFAEALGVIARGATDACAQDTLKILARLFENNRNASRAAAIVHGIGNLAVLTTVDAVRTAGVDALRKALKRQEVEVQRVAVTHLRRLGPAAKAAVPELEDVFLKGALLAEAREALKAILQTDNVDVVPKMVVEEEEDEFDFDL